MSAPTLTRGAKPLLTPRSSAILAQKAGRAIEFILARGTLPVLYWLKKDILCVPAERELRNLEKYGERIRILEAQGPDGGWRLKKAAAPGVGGGASRLQVSTRNCFKLHDFGCGPEDEPLRKAIEFILSHLSREGAFCEPGGRELPLGGQSLSLTLLCRLGLESNFRVQKGFRRIVKAQRADGGWSTPRERTECPAVRSRGRRTASSSPRVTGLALGALAESSHWKHSREAHRAGEWLLDCFFSEQQAGESEEVFRWSEITYPFWTTSILSCLDALSRMGYRPEDRKLRLSLEWLMRHQQPAGQWESKRDKASVDDHLWVTLSVLRVLRRFGLISP